MRVELVSVRVGAGVLVCIFEEKMGWWEEGRGKGRFQIELINWLQELRTDS